MSLYVQVYPSVCLLAQNTKHRVVGERTVDEVEFIDNEESLMQYVLSKNGEQISVILDLNRVRPITYSLTTFNNSINVLHEDKFTVG